jgi:hypothetical protein
MFRMINIPSIMPRAETFGKVRDIAIRLKKGGKEI